MGRRFQELRDKLPVEPERRARVEALKRWMDAATDLCTRGELRGLTPKRLAAILVISDEDFERVERLENVQVENLAAYVRALGVELEVRAVFPDGAVLLPYDDFSENEVTTTVSVRT